MRGRGRRLMAKIILNFHFDYLTPSLIHSMYCFQGRRFPISPIKNIERPFCSIWIFDGRIWQNIYSLIMLQPGCMKFASYWQGFPSIPCWTKCQWWTFATLDILKNVRGDNVLFQRASWPWCKSYGEWCVLHEKLAGQKNRHKNDFFLDIL